MSRRVVVKNEKIDYELAKEVSLAEHIAAVCQRLNATAPPASYGLVFEHSNSYLSENDVRSDSGVPTNATLKLKLQPKAEVAQSIANLRNAQAQKKACSDLKTQMKDPIFAREFLMAQGVPLLAELVMSASGSAQTYALQALETCLQLGLASREVTPPLVAKIAALLDTQNVLAQKSALQCLTHLCSNAPYGFQIAHILKAHADRNREEVFANIIQRLASPELDTKVAALALLNGLIRAAPCERDRNDLREQLNILGVLEVVRKQLLTTDHHSWRLQAFTYQVTMHAQLKADQLTKYDKTNAAHEAQLLHLWKSAFPNETLQSRVSQQWKKMGFQGTDPATDFRGMGLMGLKNLLYFAVVHKERFRRILAASAARGARDYPVAVAGISISQMLWEMLHLSDDASAYSAPDSTPPVFTVLFDGTHAFEELYCIVFAILDRTWDELNASYMDFPVVLAAVKSITADALARTPVTVQEFRHSCNSAPVPQPEPKKKDK